MAATFSSREYFSPLSKLHKKLQNVACNNNAHETTSLHYTSNQLATYSQKLTLTLNSTLYDPGIPGYPTNPTPTTK